MNIRRLITVAALALISPVAAGAQASQACRQTVFESVDIVVCIFDAKADIRLFLNDETGAAYGHFSKLEKALAESGETLVFAMNAGMYHRDRSPVGHYVENRIETLKVNTREGPGNFHLLPNGVFFVGPAGAGVLESKAYLAAAPEATFATQSGPMLVIDGALHPRFLPDSDSLKRRNGVGVTPEGEIVFAISDAPMNFHTFARFFRDEMNCENALYLDGTISRLYAPELSRNDPGVAMGPIVGVVD